VSASSVVKTVSGNSLPLRGDEIDTDRIIPARFRTTVAFDGLGEFAFRDARFDADEKPKAHPMNDPRYAGAAILLAGRNFSRGCSREHAPQALLRAGFKAIVAVSFTDIFAGNCAAICLVALSLAAPQLEALAAAVETDPSRLFTIDLEALTVSAAGPSGSDGLSFPATITEARRQRFLTGTWDTTATLIEQRAAIAATAARLPYLSGFAPKG
jgi:3-isopropylmalate/(R)-2-methylmalate dehydratase small subunit